MALHEVDNEHETTTRLRPKLLTPDVVVVFVAVAMFGVLTLVGLSGTSLPILSPDGAPDQGAIVLGEPRPIRSDEFIAWSPIKLGQSVAGFPDQRTFGMGEVDASGWRHHIPNRSLGHALYSPFNLPLVVLPPTQGFAGYWWLPFLAGFVGCYAWFRMLGGRWRIAAPAAVLVVASPAAVWWSGWQLQGIAQATAGAALLMYAVRRAPTSRPSAFALGALSAFVAAGLPWFYQPWAICAALFVGIVTLLWGLSEPGLRRQFVQVAATFLGVFTLLSVAYLIHEWDYYQALADTVYPGARRSLGGGLGVGFLFSSLFAASVNGIDGGRLVGTNLSEFSMGWTIFLPLAIGIAVLARGELRNEPRRLLVVGTLVTSVVMSTWTIVQWPSVIARLLPLTLVTPERIAPFIGFFGITAIVLLCGDPDRWTKIRNSLDRGALVLLGSGTLILVLWVATEVRRLFLPSISGVTVVIVVFVVTSLVVLLVAGRASEAMTLSAAIAVLIAVFVNPLVAGIGALEDSDAARTLQRLDEDVVAPLGGNWASDDLFLVPLVNGTGVNALSSFNDPVDADAWRILDPDGEFELQWNRFAYILFRWEPGLASPTMENPSPDVVIVRADPCDSSFDDLELTMVISSAPLAASCLTPEATVPWQGVDRYILRRVSDG